MHQKLHMNKIYNLALCNPSMHIKNIELQRCMQKRFPPTTNNLQPPKQSGKWLVYKGYSRKQTHHITHMENMYQISIIRRDK